MIGWVHKFRLTHTAKHERLTV
jgi:hypothetical protein